MDASHRPEQAIRNVLFASMAAPNSVSSLTATLTAISSAIAFAAVFAIVTSLAPVPASAAAKTPSKVHNRHHGKIRVDVPMPRPRPPALASAAGTGGNSGRAVVLPRPAPAVILTAAEAASLLAPGPLSTALQPAERQDVPLPPVPAAVALRGGMFAKQAALEPLARPSPGPFASAPTTSTSAADLAALRRIADAAQKGNDAEADAAEKTLSDPVARKLAEWMILRSYNTKPNFERYANFIAANPTWPHVALFRRRAENTLWNDNVDDADVLRFFSHHQPTTAKGRYVLARALLSRGDRAGAQALVSYAWRHEDCSADVEKHVLDMFGALLSKEDHRIRMDQRFYDDDTEAGMRAAERLGGKELAIGRAWTAVIKRASNAKALLDAVPSAARGDPAYLFLRAQWLRKHDKPEEAARLHLSAPRDAFALVDVNQWWQERRILIRDLLDKNDARTAYRLARDAVTPTQGNYRVDKYFTAGWIALRFLHDAKTAAAHFALIDNGTDNPHALSRAGYWQGRAAEAMGLTDQAKAFYRRAARHSATYYGQLARARLGLTDLGLIGPPTFTAHERQVLSHLEVVRAAEILYAIDERDMVASMYAELGESASDVGGMAMLAEVAAKHHDPRAMLLIGNAGLGRGLPLDYYAYPTYGLPGYSPITAPIEPALLYSIARQESHFNQKVVSPAQAYGFMQVTPAAAKDTAKRFKVSYNKDRLLSDPVYNCQMGAAELSMLLHSYNGSYLMTFAGYNAGRGRVRQWVAAYGDPRDPSVDPVDWAERIPLSETRNYVQRIMENMQVYRARFGGGGRLLIEADIRRGATN
jgi:soluble lytic murein transglycosylase